MVQACLTHVRPSPLRLNRTDCRQRRIGLWLAVRLDVRDTSRVGVGRPLATFPAMRVAPAFPVATPHDLSRRIMNPEPSRKFTARPAFKIETRRARDALRPYLCLFLLLWQVALLTYHRFSAGRLNRLAPFSGQTRYLIGGSIDAVPLEADAVRQRYGLDAIGAVAGSPEDLRRILHDREQQGQSAATVYLRLHTRRNGGAEEIWLWPQR